MNDKTLVERLREHRVILKSGDYDGAQLMRAWCDMINAADTIEALQSRIEALEAALRRMIYETTHLSPMKPNGDHDCTIKADALEQARQALESKP